MIICHRALRRSTGMHCPALKSQGELVQAGPFMQIHMVSELLSVLKPSLRDIRVPSHKVSGG